MDGKHIAYLVVTTSNALPVEIGRNCPTTGQYRLGKLDDVRIWNVARQGTDVRPNYQRQLDGLQPGLVANWWF